MPPDRLFVLVAQVCALAGGPGSGFPTTVLPVASYDQFMRLFASANGARPLRLTFATPQQPPPQPQPQPRAAATAPQPQPQPPPTVLSLASALGRVEWALASSPKGKGATWGRGSAGGEEGASIGCGREEGDWDDLEDVELTFDVRWRGERGTTTTTTTTTTEPPSSFCSAPLALTLLPL